MRAFEREIGLTHALYISTSGSGGGGGAIGAREGGGGAVRPTGVTATALGAGGAVRADEMPAGARGTEEELPEGSDWD